MNERIWEGVIQVLRPDDSPLTATARLWRRDDFFGTDWGGQLEIPIALRRALPPGEYTVVLGPDREAVAFIGLGPSNAASTFPTLTGTGAPPFGAPVPDHEESEDAAQVEETAAEPATGPTETPVELPTPARAQSKPKRATRSTATPKPRQAAAVKTASIEQEPVVSEVAAVGADISPVPAQPIPLEVPIMGLNASNGASAGPIGQTEHLARAFLTAVESRDRLLAVDASGVEAQLLAALQDLVDDMTAHIELRLRGGTGSSPYLPQQVVIVSWLASVLGTAKERADLVDLASNLEQLVGAVRSADTEASAVAA